MSPVRFCRRVVACIGAFILLAGVAEILTTPAQWRDALEMFSGAVLCLTIVRQVDRREGGWHEEAFKKPTTKPEPPEA